MKLLNLVLVIIIVLLISFVFIVNFLPKNPQAEINGHAFALYLAKTSQEREIGLAKYKSLAKDQGMLFLFEKPDYYSFWMKNMHFPIDIIFVRDEKIVDIFQNVPDSPNDNLPVYTTRTKADKVLEVNAGLAKKYGIKIGSIVKLKL